MEPWRYYIFLSGKDGVLVGVYLEPWAPRLGIVLNDTGGGGSIPHAHMLVARRALTARIHYSCWSFDHEGIKLSQHGTQHSKSAWLTRVGSLTSLGSHGKKKSRGMFISVCARHWSSAIEVQVDSSPHAIKLIILFVAQFPPPITFKPHS